MAALAQKCGLAALADEHLSVPTDKGANAGAKVSSLVAGMVAGADSIDDMALLRHGAMSTVFDRPYAPSTLGSFLRAFAFGHVRQLDAVATRVLGRLAQTTPLLDGIDGPVCVDIDDTIIEVHGYAKQGSGYGYSGVRGLNALFSTITTQDSAPVITGQRLRKGACGSPRGAARMIADTLATVARLRPSGSTATVLVRADSAYKTMADLINAAQSARKPLTYSTAGIGTPQHLTTERLAQKTGTQWVHAPYKSGPEAITALMRGDVDFMAQTAEWVPYVRDGRLRLLSVFTGERIKGFDAPTLKELGYDLVAPSILGIAGPARMDAAIVKKLQDAFHKAIQTAEFQSCADQFGLKPDFKDSAAFGAFLKDTLAGWTPLLRQFASKE